MRALALLLLCHAALLPPLAAQQRVDRGARADATVSLRIHNLDGRTRVTAWDRDSVHVRGTVAAGSRFVMGGTPQAMKAATEHEAPGASGGSAELDIRVPRGARVWVKSGGGVVEVDGVAEVDVATVSGGITIGGTHRYVAAESLDGPITLSGQADVTRAKTGGGAITITGLPGDVTAGSVSGTVSVSSTAPLASAVVTSVTGTVAFRAGVARGGSIELQTHGALVELSLPAAQHATVDISAFSGKVVSGFPGATRTATEGQPVRYTLGDGGARIVVRSLKGGVRLDAH